MKTAIEQLQDNKVKLTVTVEAADVNKAIADTYKDFSGRVAVPGFRKGKVPRPVIDSAVGGKAVILGQVTEDVVNHSYPLAVDENDLFPVARPEFEDNTTTVEEGKDYTYNVTVEVEPTFELDSYEPVSVALPSAEVTDEEVAQQVDIMLGHYNDFMSRGLHEESQDGDRLTLKIEAETDGGRNLENLTSDEFSYTIGSGLMPETFDAEVLGVKVGDKKSFEIPVPLAPTHYLADLAGKALKVAFTVEVRAIFGKVNPELTDEWVSETFGMDTVEEFQTRIREMIASDKEQSLPQLKEDRVMKVLRERLQGEPSAAMCEDKESELMQNFFQQLQRGGMTFDAYLKNFGLTTENFRDDIKKQAKEQCAENLALNAWAKHEGLTISAEEISAEFAKADPEHAAELEKEWTEAGQLHLLRQGMLREKAFHAVVDAAVVTEEVPAAAEEAPAEEKPAKKKTTRKSSKKAAEAEAPAAEAEAEAPAAEAEAEAPAAE